MGGPESVLGIPVHCKRRRGETDRLCRCRRDRRRMEPGRRGEVSRPTIHPSIRLLPLLLYLIENCNVAARQLSVRRPCRVKSVATTLCRPRPSPFFRSFPAVFPATASTSVVRTILPFAFSTSERPIQTFPFPLPRRNLRSARAFFLSSIASPSLRCLLY